ncbi:MAG: amidohydrolase family protein [bacterium]
MPPKAPSEEPGTLLVTGGRVLALDGSPRPAEAIVLRNGRVAGVGSERAMEILAGSGAERLDAQGSTVMPGLVDTHPHLLHFGVLSHPLVDLSDAKSHAEIAERIRRRASELPAGKWLMATPVGEPHYFLRRSFRDLEERTLPDRRILDQAAPGHPVMIQAWAPVTPNVCALNSAALAALGINRDTPDRVENVWIEKDARGEPTGILHGSVNTYYSNDRFMNGLLKGLPLLDPESALPGTRRAMAEYNRLGVTTVYEGHMMGPLEMEVYRTLRAQGALTVRVLMAAEAEVYGVPWAQPLTTDEFRLNLETALAGTDLHDELCRTNGVTVSRGGPCWPGFLRMLEPYRGPYGEQTRGVTFVSGEKERMAIEFCAASGLRLNCINTGSRDHDEFLDRAESILAERPGASRGWILQHVYLITAGQAKRYAALGFQVTTSMSFSWGKGDLIADRIGEHVLDDLIPLRRLLDAGLVVGCGTDWGPKNVFEHVQLAETHCFCGSGRRNRGAGQPVTRLEALLMWTRDAARVLGWQGIGTLRPGHHADLIVVDRDPLTCDLDDLPGTRVLRTYLGGRVVYDSGEL